MADSPTITTAFASFGVDVAPAVEALTADIIGVLVVSATPAPPLPPPTAATAAIAAATAAATATATAAAAAVADGGGSEEARADLAVERCAPSTPFDLTTQRRRRKEAHMTAQLLLAWCSLFQLFAHMKAFRRQASTSYHLTRPKPTERCKAFKVVGKYQAGEEKLLVTLRVGH